MPIRKRILRIARFKVIRARVYGLEGDFRFYMDVKYIPGRSIQETKQNIITAGETVYWKIMRNQIEGYPRVGAVVFDNGIEVRY